MGDAAAIEVEDVIPREPQQQATFHFPKRSFGEKVPVLLGFQPVWFRKWPFLHYNEAKDLVYCHTCLLCSKEKKTEVC
jgi:hypothetical protein